MVGELRIGEYRMLNNSFHQYPSFMVYQVKSFNDKQVVIKRIAHVAIKDPYNGVTEFDEYIADKNFAIIVNSEPLDKHLAVHKIFGRKWEYFYG